MQTLSTDSIAPENREVNVNLNVKGNVRYDKGAEGSTRACRKEEE